MINPPLVSIICLCYNHERFVAECLNAVFSQTYPAIELIIIDDYSKDNSVSVIQSMIRPQDIFIQNGHNKGICKSFNSGLARAKGKYVVDLAADDQLFPDTIARQVAFFETLSDEYGAIFGDAVLIDEQGKAIGSWRKRDVSGNVLSPVPQGDVFAEVLAGTPILTVTAMTRKTVYDALEGYDETLVYEDFDFLVRASRQWKYAYSDQQWIMYRQVPGSDSRSQALRRTKHLESTFQVCAKAAVLVKTDREREALLLRLQDGLRQCLFLEHYELAEKYVALHQQFRPLNRKYRAIAWACQKRIPFYQVYHTFQRIRKK
ncbi:MAG: glycosyltransferase [Siphonobacter sp.]